MDSTQYFTEKAQTDFQGEDAAQYEFEDSDDLLCPQPVGVIKVCQGIINDRVDEDQHGGKNNERDSNNVDT